jgi:hypothetical protein
VPTGSIENAPPLRWQVRGVLLGRARSAHAEADEIVGSKRTMTPLDVGVLLISATLSSGTRTLVSG